MTLVTVALNVYNGMPYLPAAVDSILAQTHCDFDFLIVNDGSHDDSLGYLESLKDPRIRIINQENLGCSAASNAAIKACRTKYLARMDADDLSLPERIETQLEFLENHPDVAMVGCQTACLGTRGVGSSINLPTKHSEIWDSLMHGRHAMAHPTVMMRTELIRSIGGYWSHKLADDDTDMMLRMGEVGQLANLDSVQLHYRIHQGSLSAANVRGMRFSYEYAIELARRRQAGLNGITPQEFEQQKQARPWYVRCVDSLDIYARWHYRGAMEDMYGDHPLRGRIRLAWAALCSPLLTIQRLRRMLHRDQAQAH